ncbi:MAG: hypothetical protein GXO76_06935 [Calditrichaeota bacterium]|nr:hypothetical protein [Calditrichota bacterium]
MEEELLNQVIRFLKGEKDFVVAAKKIWKHMVALPKWRNLDFEDFVDILKQSPELDVIGDMNENPFKGAGLTDEETQEEIRKMEELGYYFGPSVVLKSHVPTPQELAGFLGSKIDQAYHDLLKVWDNRPKNDPESEDHLLEILAEVQRLRREIQQNLEKSQSTQEDS